MDGFHEAIGEAFGAAVVGTEPVGGGCVHDARRVVLEDGRVWFAKQSAGSDAECLRAEEHGLRLLAGRIRCPRVSKLIALADGGICLVMEWIDLRAHDASSWESLGGQLAAMHQTHGERYGLDRDNFIGVSPQANGWADSWSEFYCERRLRPQLEMAARCLRDLSVAEILGKAERAFEGYDPPPALLHGDLWTGNTAALANGEAVVFDPAPYFGDAETDLAMLELFGGPLPEPFLQGYGRMDDGRAMRKPWYDLYHALNHVNLFGSGYGGMVKRCLHEIGCIG